MLRPFISRKSDFLSLWPSVTAETSFSDPQKRQRGLEMPGKPWVQKPRRLPQWIRSLWFFRAVWLRKFVHAGEGSHKAESDKGHTAGQICHKRHWPYKVDHRGSPWKWLRKDDCCVFGCSFDVQEPFWRRHSFLSIIHSAFYGRSARVSAFYFRAKAGYRLNKSHIHGRDSIGLDFIYSYLYLFTLFSKFSTAVVNLQSLHFCLKTTKNYSLIFVTWQGWVVQFLPSSSWFSSHWSRLNLLFSSLQLGSVFPIRLVHSFSLLPCSRRLCLVRVLFIFQLTVSSCVRGPPSRVCWTVCNYPQGLPWATLPGTSARIRQLPPPPCSPQWRMRRGTETVQAWSWRKKSERKVKEAD